MQTTPQQLPGLSEYCDIADITKKIPDFRTVDAFRWFIRTNRDRLTACGALIHVVGRIKFHPDLTKQVVVEAGHLAAVDRAEKQGAQSAEQPKGVGHVAPA